MAIKLQCPKCGGELPASFSRGTKGVCPACSKSFEAPRVTAIRKQGTIVRAKAYRPPPSVTVRLVENDEPKSSKRWILALLLLLFIAGGGAAVWSTTRAPADKSADQVAALAPNSPNAQNAPGKGDAAKNPAAAPQVAAPQVTPSQPQNVAANNAAAKDVLPDDVVTTTVPKQQLRPAPKIEAAAPSDAPVAFAEFRAAPVGGVPNMKNLPFSKSVDQDKVDIAIKKGQDFLKSKKDTWLKNRLGYAALPALALLETGVPKEDLVIQDAAAAVRRLGPESIATYDMSLAILFLDRLGDPGDEALIRTLGLRLIAGQTMAHGWNYQCQKVPPTLEPELLKLLEKLRPEGQWQIPLAREQGKSLIDLAIPLAKAPPARLDLSLPLEIEPMKPAMKDDPNLVVPLNMLGDNAKLAEILKDAPEALKGLAVARPFDDMPNKNNPGMPKLPLVGGRPKVMFRGGLSGRDDNSNSQFALLALWAARRHGVPVERSLLLADQRYAMTQSANGWHYHASVGGGTPAMTCVGLLGLALGHGALLSDAKAPAKGAGDPAIERGLQALSKWIGEPNEPMQPPNLYYLWSVERVAMLYQLKTIGGKDWYGWGANHLLKAQAQDGPQSGAWVHSSYPGSAPPIDTSFALLFLHRSNLVADLSQQLQLHMPIRGD